METPPSLRYTPFHLWVAPQADGTVLAGITDHAQQTLGDIVFVEPPASGSVIHAEQPCGIIESVKAASDLHAPITGTVVEVNEPVRNAPEQINESPYAAWIFRLRPDDAGALDQLLDADSYRQLLGD